LAAGLHPDPLGELKALTRLPSWISRVASQQGGEGKERQGRKGDVGKNEGKKGMKGSKKRLHQLFRGGFQ